MQQPQYIGRATHQIGHH